MMQLYLFGLGLGIAYAFTWWVFSIPVVINISVAATNRQEAKASNSLLKNQMAWSRKRHETGISVVERRLFSRFTDFWCPKQTILGRVQELFRKIAQGNSPNHSEKPPKNGRWRY